MKIQMHFKYQMDCFSLCIDWESNKNRIGILGASGCGKSMTLKALAGIITPDSGKIIINDKTYFDSEKQINIPPQKRKIGYLFQNYALFPTMTVEQNISMGLLKCSKSEINKKVDAMISRFQLEELRYRYPHELSGGQQQRVALARILAYEPDLILLDEPFSALDTFLKDNLIHEMQEILKEYKGTMIIVSHSRDEIYTLSDYLFILDKGHIVESNDTKDIFQSPYYVESAKLTGCRNISPIERIDEHTCYAKSWGLTFHTNRIISDDMYYIGFRAHDLLPVKEPGENTFSFKIKSITETPFETVYYLQPQLSEQKNFIVEDICYKCAHNLSKEQPIISANYMAINQDKLYLLCE